MLIKASPTMYCASILCARHLDTVVNRQVPCPSGQKRGHRLSLTSAAEACWAIFTNSDIGWSEIRLPHQRWVTVGSHVSLLSSFTKVSVSLHWTRLLSFLHLHQQMTYLCNVRAVPFCQILQGTVSHQIMKPQSLSLLSCSSTYHLFVL